MTTPPTPPRPEPVATADLGGTCTCCQREGSGDGWKVLGGYLTCGECAAFIEAPGMAIRLARERLESP